MKAPTKDRIKIFIFDAVISILAFLAIQGAAGALYGTFQKIRWAFQVIDQLDKLGPDYHNILPPPPNSDKGKTDLSSWIRQNLPKSGAADYAEVGEIFLDTAQKLRAGELEGKREAYADTARRLAAAVDRATWTPFIIALTERAEAESAELADLFEICGNTIKAQAAGYPAPVNIEGGRIA